LNPADIKVKELIFHKPDPKAPHLHVLEFLKEDDKSKFIRDDVRKKLNLLRSFSSFKAALSTARLITGTTKLAQSMINHSINKGDFSRLNTSQKMFIKSQFEVGQVETPIVLHSKTNNDDFIIYGEELLQYGLYIKRKPIKIARILY
jgi:hypothetical protein